MRYKSLSTNISSWIVNTYWAWRSPTQAQQDGFNHFASYVFWGFLIFLVLSAVLGADLIDAVQGENSRHGIQTEAR